MATVRPFRFTNLKRLTAAQVAVQESLAYYLTQRPLAPTFKESLAGLLERYLKVPAAFGETELRPIARKELGTLLPHVGCLVIVGASPTEHKILVELDPALVAFAVERLLGGAGDNGRILRPLTEIEAGVLSFLVLKLIAAFAVEWHNGREIALTLDRFASNLSEIGAVVDSVNGYQMLGVRVAVGKRNGYARIFLPEGLITQSFAAPPAQGPADGHELAYMRRTLPHLTHLGAVARVEAAVLDLTEADLEKLEPGDIVLLENHEIEKGPNGVGGNVFVKLGRGQNGGLRGRLLNEGERLQLEITQLVVQEQPAEAENMVRDGDGQPTAGEGTGGGEADNLEESQGLLRDVAAPVVVELGRLRLNATQVARLKAGQILRLPRGPNDPVDLVVSGKIFARGELVEVDGELGVRLLKVANVG